ATSEISGRIATTMMPMPYSTTCQRGGASPRISSWKEKAATVAMGICRTGNNARLLQAPNRPAGPAARSQIGQRVVAVANGRCQERQDSTAVRGAIGQAMTPTTGRHALCHAARLRMSRLHQDRKSTRLNSSHVKISYAVFCLKKK